MNKFYKNLVFLSNKYFSNDCLLPVQDHNSTSHLTENDGVKYYYIANVLWMGQPINIIIDLDELSDGATSKEDINHRLDRRVKSAIFKNDLNNYLFTDLA